MTDRPITVFSINTLRVMVLVLLAAFIYTGYQLKKANTCNKAFRLWFYYNHGVVINMDKFYEDAVKWVNDPQYEVEEIK